MKILYLYSKLPAYQIPVFKEFINTYKAELHIVYEDTPGDSPFIPEIEDNIIFYKLSSMSSEILKKNIINIKPDIVFVVAWQIRKYLSIVNQFRINGIPVIAGFDDIWLGNMRQKIGFKISWILRKKYFSHAWVSGPRQYEYAKKFGFKDDNIIYYLYSCDTTLFQKNFEKNFEQKKNSYPKTFLFIGRHVHVKGVDILVEAFNIYRTKYKGDWNLICVGNGKLKNIVKSNKNIQSFEFSNQEQLLLHINNSGAFILPSRFDPSPLVIHEATSSGLPIVISKNIGHRLLFLIDGFNGYSFAGNSAENLALSMLKISNKSTEELVEMCYNSISLSKQHNAKYVAASFLSVLE